MDIQNYERTLAGSVGASTGASMGASGGTYFILEYKTPSKYHQVGKFQKIIVDQVELGRDASCQVHFGESFETVNHEHATIVRDGESWKLIHLSHFNPTLVNGHSINGSYYLQTGDEIQLFIGGPRLGFITSRGRQALAPSIDLTEGVSFFRKQTLRPYKTALTAMGIAFVLAVAGLAVWNYSLSVRNDLLARRTEQREVQLRGYQNQLDLLGAKRAALETQQRELEAKLRTSDGGTKALKSQPANVNNQLGNVNANFYKVKPDLDSLSGTIAAENATEEVEEASYKLQTTRQARSHQDNVESGTVEEQDHNASGDLKDYYDHTYTIKVDHTETGHNGSKFDPGIQVSDIICGTGFMLSDGTSVTNRRNVELWIFSSIKWKDSRRGPLAIYRGAGCNIILHYRAYSTKGTGKPLTLTSADFSRNQLYDTTLTETEAEKLIRIQLRECSIELAYRHRNYVQVSIVTPAMYNWVYIRDRDTFGEDLPLDTTIANSMNGGIEIQMVDYAGHADIHNPTPVHFNDHTNISDIKHRTIVSQNRVAEPGYYGSPAFLPESGIYQVVGFMIDSVGGRGCLVPIGNIK